MHIYMFLLIQDIKGFICCKYKHNQTWCKDYEVLLLKKDTLFVPSSFLQCFMFTESEPGGDSELDAALDRCLMASNVIFMSATSCSGLRVRTFITFLNFNGKQRKLCPVITLSISLAVAW